MLTFMGSMTHITSLISHGVFEKFPDLKVLIRRGPGSVGYPGCCGGSMPATGRCGASCPG